MESLIKKGFNFSIRRYKDDFEVTIFYDIIDSATCVGKKLEDVIKKCLVLAEQKAINLDKEECERIKLEREEYNKQHPNCKKLQPVGKSPPCLFCGKPVTRAASGFNNTRYAKFCCNKCLEKWHSRKRAHLQRLIREGKKLKSL